MSKEDKMKVLEAVLTALEFFNDVILLVLGIPCILAWIVFLCYSVVEVATSDITIQEEQCFMSIDVNTCVRQVCPNVDSCSTEEHKLAWFQCHDECVAQ